MYRLSWFLVVALCLVSAAKADDAKNKDAAKEKIESAIAELRTNPDDVKALDAFMSASVQQLIGIVDSDADAAEKQLKDMTDLLSSLEPKTDDGKKLLGRANQTMTSLRQRVELARGTLEDFEKKFRENRDSKSLNLYMSKFMVTVSPQLRSQPDAAAEQVTAVREVLEEASAHADANLKTLIDRQLKQLDALNRTIDSGRKLAALIGKDAAPLNVSTWVNGAPLTETDLKGKVVLLDFWAVWCGPCIATFPHLREWNEKYADKGLVMIGLTQYYNYDWNEDMQRATRAEAKVSPEQEQKMLERFAEHHELKHRFGIQEDRSLSAFYGVEGIPQVVVIDRDGKVRLIRVGSGPDNARDIEKMLEQLIAGS